MLEAEVTSTGDVLVNGQHIGRLQGFRFILGTEAAAPADGQDMHALRAAAQTALANEMEARAERLSNNMDDAFVLANDGVIRWNGDAVGKVVEGEKLLSPHLRVLADDSLTDSAREKIEGRLLAWLKAHVAKLLGALNLLETADDITGLAQKIALQIVGSLGMLERSRVAQDMKALDQEGRAMLRRHGVRFGAFHIYTPQLLKPAPRALAAQLWALKNGGLEQPGLDDIAHLALSGRTSFKLLPDVAKGLYRAAGFRVCGERVLRIDILERLADLIRPAAAYRPGVTPGEPPEGSADGEGFVVTVSMTSLAGCAGDDFSSILRSLGYASEKRMGPAITAALAEAPRKISAPVEATDSNISTAGTAPEDTSEEAETTAAANASDTAEPQEIEIWHFQRQQHAPRPETDDRRNRSNTKNAGNGRQDRSQQLERFGAPSRAHAGDKNARGGNGQRGKSRSPHSSSKSQNKPWQTHKGTDQRANRAPDPDSPFAKLAALKQSLESNKG